MLILENRRSSLRLHRPTQVSANEHRATMLNLSISGARLVMPEARQRVDLEFHLDGRNFRLRGRTVWTQPLAGSEYVVAGIRFEGPGEVELHELSRYVVREYYQLTAA